MAAIRKRFAWLEELSRDDRANIAEMKRHAGWRALVSAIYIARDAYIKEAGYATATSRDPIDQRKVDEKRGFFAGALFALEKLPELIEADHKRFVAEALKEAEELGRTRGDG